MRIRNRRRGLVAVAGLATATLALAACGGGSSGGSSATPSSTNTDPACADYAKYGSFPGTKVTILTSILPPEQQLYEKSWAQFSKCTGITVVYEGTDQFEAQLPTRVAGGNAPNIAFIPQPGLLNKLSKNIKPAPQAVQDNAGKYWNPSIVEYGKVNGTLLGAPLSTNMKSLVWYSPKFFTSKGYKVPATWDEMFTLSDQMVKDGVKPWCGGIESGGATGWPATDWIEQIFLRQQGGDKYNQWVAHEIKFESPEFTQAMDTLNKWMRNPAYVNASFGDVKTIATVSFQDAIKPIPAGKCGMLQQASFIANQLPKGSKIAEDGDAFAFYLPPISPDVKTPIVGGGEIVAAFSDAPRGPGVPDLPVVARVRDHEGEAGHVGLLQQRRTAGRLHRPDLQAVGPAARRPHRDLPVRRLRPDARRRRRGVVLEADDRLVRREQGHRGGREGPRRVLAGLLAGTMAA